MTAAGGIIARDFVVVDSDVQRESFLERDLAPGYRQGWPMSHMLFVR